MKPADYICRCAELLGTVGPFDAPVSPDGPAQAAADLARRGLEDPAATPEERAYLHINLANALRSLGPAHDGEAQSAYQAALSTDPDKGWWWFDLGVCHKWRGRFEEAASCAERARRLTGNEKPILWNLAIAATGCGDGARAVELWNALGIFATTIGAEARPFVEGLPPVRVRIAGRGPGLGRSAVVPPEAASFEVLSAVPLSPCHGVIQSASYLETLVDYGDVVLWDGAPVDVDESGVPCFPLLARLAQGKERRFRFVAIEREPEQLTSLGARLPEGTHVFVHRARFHHACSRCAEGGIEDHEHRADEGGHLIYGKIIVPAEIDLEDFRTAYDRVLKKEVNITIALPGLHEAIGDTRRAGQHHKAWAAIEKSAFDRQDHRDAVR